MEEWWRKLWASNLSVTGKFIFWLWESSEKCFYLIYLNKIKGLCLDIFHYKCQGQEVWDSRSQGPCISQYSRESPGRWNALLTVTQLWLSHDVSKGLWIASFCSLPSTALRRQLKVWTLHTALVRRQMPQAVAFAFSDSTSGTRNAEVVTFYHFPVP